MLQGERGGKRMIDERLNFIKKGRNNRARERVMSDPSVWTHQGEKKRVRYFLGGGTFVKGGGKEE